MDSSNLKKLREQAKLTQEELAHRTGISYSSIVKYEANRVGNPSYKHVKAIASVIAACLGITVNKVLTDLENEPIAA